MLRRRGHDHVAASCAPAAAAAIRFLDLRHAEEIASAPPGHLVGLLLAPPPDLPVVLRRDVDAASVHVDLRVPPDLRALRGHFAALPIVPGVVHLAWALHFARADLGVTTALRGMDQVKFRRIVQPGHRLVLSVTLAPQRDILSFRLGRGDELFSAGRLYLDTGGA
jgi:hypothetical protein